MEPTVRQQDAPIWVFSDLPIVGQTLNITHASEPPPFVYVKAHGYVRDFAALPVANVPFAVSRRYLDLQGQPLGSRPLTQGELAVVELTITSMTNEDIPNIAVVDRLPAGLEIENPRLGREHRLPWLPEGSLFEPEYIDLRDDRIQIFGTLPAQGYRLQDSTRRFYYVVRAVTPGDFTAPPALLEVMYDPEKIDYTGYERLSIGRR
jgi:uncharacterized protein YfaS (alpha-2-macroglobulin family)